MGHTNDGKITAPVNTDDVNAVLNHASHDVATLCMSAKINKWAKYKPEKTGSFSTLALSQRKANNFGLAPDAIYDSKTAFVNAVKNGTFSGGWTYTRPGSNDWKRIDDFVGYNHNATAPFGALGKYEGVLGSNSSVTTKIPMTMPQISTPDAASDNGVLSLADFEKADADYKNWYLGILLYQSSRQIMATMPTTILNSTQWQVDMGYLSTGYAGTWKGIPFLSSKPYTNGGAEPSGVKIIGIGQTGVDVVLKTSAAAYTIFLSIYFRDSTSNVMDYTLQITNRDTANKTFGSVTIQLATNVSGASAYNALTQANVTVNAGQTWTKTGTINATNRTFQYARATAVGISPDMNWMQVMLAPMIAD